MAAFSQKQLAGIRASFAASQRIRDAADAAAPEVMAIKITYDTPAPDGTFEILFMRREKADQFETCSGTHEIISFSEGVNLARQPDCCGGQHALHEQARRFQRLNPFVQKLGLKLD